MEKCLHTTDLHLLSDVHDDAPRCYRVGREKRPQLSISTHSSIGTSVSTPALSATTSHARSSSVTCPALASVGSAVARSRLELPVGVRLSPADWRVHRRRAVKVDLLDVGPRHILGALTAVDEDQHADIPIAEVTGALELQLLAAM